MTDIFEVLGMKRYKLLYFLTYYRGRLKDEPGIKARLARIFGYKSDGHFYTDWKALFDDGFLVSEGGYIVVTRKADRQFSFILALNIMRWLSIVVGIVLVAFVVSTVLDVNPPWLVLNSVYIVGLSAGFILAMAFIAHYTYKIFVPALPSKKEFRDSNI